MLVNDRQNFEKTPIDVIRAIDKLHKIGEVGIKEELRSKNMALDDIEDHLFKIKNAKPTENLKHIFESLKQKYSLKEGENFVFDPTLARGLDYYTGAIFELKPSKNPENLTIGSGGRYDNLIGELGGQATPAVGFAGGIERVIAELKTRQVGIPLPAPPDLFLACLGETAKKKAIRLFEDLRRQGIRVAESFTKDGLKSQLEIANRLKVKFTLVIGQKELTDGTIIVRDMENGIQEIVDFNKIADEIQKRLKVHQPDTLA